MHTRFFRLAVTFVVAGGAIHAQSQPRRMTQMGGGSPDRGKCTVEVVVDGSAEVEIRGDTAILRNLAGRQPQWRRFQCTGPLPRNPGDFRFAGVDGRGHQQLVGDPRNGGPAVIRIDDPDNGQEGYTFDIMWNNAAPPPPTVERRPEDRRGPDDRRPGFDRDGDAFHHDRDEAFHREDWRMHLFGRIREDIDHIQSETFAFGSDQYRLARAKQELNELQDMLAQRRYDRRELDDVVMALKRVLNDNRLARRDRETLADDLSRLQDFRDHFRDYGVQ